MATLSRFQQKLIADGYCDERGAGFCATMTKSPTGIYGMVCLCVHGNTLCIYDVNVKGDIIATVFRVNLSEITDLKIRMNIFSQKLSFAYCGGRFSFTNFLGVRPALKVIEEESLK